MAKKKYAINWEDDLPVSFEVNGVQYENLEDIPNEADRRKLEAMLDSSFASEFDDPEFEQLQKETSQINGVAAEKVILWIFSGIAALMLLIAGISSFSAISKMSREASAPGVVVEILEKQYVDDETDVISTYYYPVVEFTARDGKSRSVQMSEGSNVPSHEVGEEVTVLYEPEHPLKARIKSAESTALMFILPGITGILGIGFLIAVIVVWKLMLPPTEAVVSDV